MARRKRMLQTTSNWKTATKMLTPTSPLDVLIAKLKEGPRKPKVSPQDAAKIRIAKKLGATYKPIKAAAGVSEPTIFAIIKGRPPYLFTYGNGKQKVQDNGREG